MCESIVSRLTGVKKAKAKPKKTRKQPVVCLPKSPKKPSGRRPSTAYNLRGTVKEESEMMDDSNQSSVKEESEVMDESNRS